MSLIIQYGLPRHLARKAHPEVKGWEPVFKRGNNRMLRDTIRWIESMMQPRPEYPVAYEPPKPPAAAEETLPETERAPR